MGKILNSLLTDQLHVDSGTERRTSEQLEETLFDEACCAEQLKFERSFRLGVLIITEIFFGQDIFLQAGYTIKTV